MYCVSLGPIGQLTPDEFVDGRIIRRLCGPWPVWMADHPTNVWMAERPETVWMAEHPMDVWMANHPKKVWMENHPTAVWPLARLDG